MRSCWPTPRRATCTSRRCWRPRRGGCCATTASAAWRPSSRGNWLDFRRFEEHNAVDRERFPSFTNELRQAMFEEPIRFFVDVAQRNRSVLDLLYGDRHVRQPGPGQALRHARAAERRTRTTGSASTTPQRYGRGGLLPMAVFLTKNAPGLRTSPVKRGYWVVRRLLGEQIPAAAADGSRAAEGRGEAGRADAAASCWPGTATTRAAPAATAASTRSAWSSRATARSANGAPRTWAAGRSRPRRPSPTAASGTGLDGLRQYLREQRQDDFVDNLCRKLFAYAPGPQPAAFGRDDDRRRCGPGWRPTATAFGSLVEIDRHQPAVSEQARARTIRAE